MKDLMMELGPPTFFITINPADPTIHWFYIMQGKRKKINLDAPFSENWFSKQERCNLVGRDPVAAAKCFHKIVEVWLETILGVKKQGNNEIGILGRVSGYYGTVETQGRGSLHLHMLVWIHGSMSQDELTRRLEDGSSFSDSMKEYMLSVISEQYPDGDVPPEDFPDEKGDKHV